MTELSGKLGSLWKRVPFQTVSGSRPDESFSDFSATSPPQTFMNAVRGLDVMQAAFASHIYHVKKCKSHSVTIPIYNADP